jgi:hypothetical protein
MEPKDFPRWESALPDMASADEQESWHLKIKHLVDKKDISSNLYKKKYFA